MQRHDEGHPGSRSRTQGAVDDPIMGVHDVETALGQFASNRPAHRWIRHGQHVRARWIAIEEGQTRGGGPHSHDSYTVHGALARFLVARRKAEKSHLVRPRRQRPGQSPNMSLYAAMIG